MVPGDAQDIVDVHGVSLLRAIWNAPMFLHAWQGYVLFQRSYASSLVLDPLKYPADCSGSPDYRMLRNALSR
jgi:hypothetical protein